MARQRTWKNITIELHCWIVRGILNVIHVAVAYNVTNRKLTTELSLEHVEGNMIKVSKAPILFNSLFRSVLYM